MIRGIFRRVTDAGKVIGASFGVTPSTQAFGDAASEGSNASAARADHKHGMPADPAPTYVVKSADETVNNSTTLQNDDHLVFSAAANSNYEIKLLLLLNSANTTADFKFFWTFPSGCTMLWGPGMGGTDISGTYFAGNSASSANPPIALLDGTGTWTQAGFAGTGGLILYGIVRNGANAGSVQLQWAQNTANASDSKVLKDSFLVYKKLQ